MATNKLKTVSLETMIDKHIGKRGTEKREAFENELRIDLLGRAIKQARQERNLTQEQLAEKVSVTRQTINAIESNRFVPSTVLALKLSRLFNKSVNDIFQLEESD
jgi:DNA-binding XRE family transcriptional regulator